MNPMHYWCRFIAVVREARDALCEYANKGEVSSDVEGLIASMSFSLGIAAAVETALRSLAQPQQAEGWVMVPMDVLKAASESLGSFVSDHGWGDADMQAMDNLDAYLAATPSAPTAVEPDERDTERLDWMEKNGGQHTVCIAGRWYVRDGYGSPHIRAGCLRSAIDAVRASKGTP